MSGAPPLGRARLDWSAQGAPASADFGDVYFSPQDGLAETRHVFLAGNGLPEAWAGRTRFVIGETGFGTGLNFLAAWQLWQRTAAADARLHYLSVEGFPLETEDMLRALRPFPELADDAAALGRAIPPATPGFHRCHFDGGRVSLTLLYGEAAAMLRQLDAGVDAWFLDGFSPARNPDMWRGEVLGEIARLTRPRGTAASFTAAGAVRRGLEEAGFAVERAPGFGAKRHMLRAWRRGDGAATVRAAADRRPRTAIVIGAGIAGASAAAALVRRGADVTVIDPDPGLTHAASGNPLGILMPWPTADMSPAGRFHCAAFAYATVQSALTDAQPGLSRCGVLELEHTAQARIRHERLAVRGLPPDLVRRLDVNEATAAAGIAMRHGGLFYPGGGVTDPRAYVAALLVPVRTVVEAKVATLITDGDGPGVMLSTGERLTADLCVVANGIDGRAFGQMAGLPLQASRGQICLARETGTSARLETVLTFGSYVAPSITGVHTLGATYDDVPWPIPDTCRQPDAADTAAILKACHAMMPELDLAEDSYLRVRAAIRCTTPDRLPVAGPLPDHAAWNGRTTSGAGLPSGSAIPGWFHDGIFLCTGLGSRGLVTAPLLGEVLASEAFGDPLPVERAVAEMLHPARFWRRRLRRVQNATRG